jgi:hypothetical protein
MLILIIKKIMCELFLWFLSKNASLGQIINFER